MSQELVSDPGYDLDYLELFADSSEFDEEFLIHEVCEVWTVEEMFENIMEMPSGIDEFEPVPSSSGLSSDKTYNDKYESISEDYYDTDDRLYDELHERAVHRNCRDFILDPSDDEIL